MIVPTATGSQVIYRSQSYIVLGLQEHTRQDGARVVLVKLGTKCPCCGAVFRLLSPPVSVGLSRRCGGCKRPGKRVTVLRAVLARQATHADFPELGVIA